MSGANHAITEKNAKKKIAKKDRDVQDRVQSKLKLLNGRIYVTRFRAYFILSSDVLKEIQNRLECFDFDDGFIELEQTVSERGAGTGEKKRIPWLLIGNVLLDV
ncbi:MAG TPA: hypothetical protein VLI92_02980 [Candidatus Saccharimonadales bacterium]|nr:hypothetical protein [Candidatus Saccharimonadales bacterium]